MVGAAKGNSSPILVSKYRKLTKQSTRQHLQVDEGKSGFAADRVWPLGALHSINFQMQLATGKRWETNWLSNQEKEKWIENFADRETGVARNWVQHAETGIMQKQEDMRNAKTTESRSRKSVNTLGVMLYAIWDSLSNLASANNDEDGEDEEGDEKESQRGKMSEDDIPDWVIGTISKTVVQNLKRYWQKQIRLNELM
jgi:hypothetical protein